MPIALTPDQQALAASLRDWATYVADLAALGVFSRRRTAASGPACLLTRCLSIVGGTTQILLTQVGERVLGLPR